MPKPTNIGIDLSNRLSTEERNYPRDALREKHDEWIGKMTDEQRAIYDEIITAVLKDCGGVFFVYGFGGTGKTFLWKTLSAAVRYRGLIAINVASSGIASLLLDGGRTAHSRFGIPINPDDFTMCNISPESDLANMLKETSLIIWDEAPMMSRYCFENLDRSLSDIMKNTDNKPFGGKVVVFGGDFRQVLPVISGAGRAQIVLAALNSSYLWEHIKVLTLTKNMRLMSEDLSESAARDIKAFSDWILAVGEGKVAEPNDGEALIDIPEEFLIENSNDPIEAISRAVYGDLEMLHKRAEPKFFQSRAILCPTNNDVNTINERLLEKLQGEEMVYLSADSIDPQDSESLNNPVFTQDFLNSIRLSGLPNHSLRLKVGAPVMLLRNIDPKAGLCNGTRLKITQMGHNVLEASVITGDRVGHKVLIPKVLIKPSDTKLPFRIRRRQFPLSIAFAMTINKSQVQSLQEVGLFLPRPVFSHGQLYVALSRVTSKKGLKILIVDKEGQSQKETMNVVFKEVFQNLRN
ncbi:ATP-dependent DNA helicase PIF1 [Capsella rubella]|nr:ATP-dependent DNA helicase PIF1 [Capsella rubella]